MNVLVGSTFGKRTVVSEETQGKTHRVTVICSCGELQEVPKYNLPRTKECRKCSGAKAGNSRFQDISGNVFGKVRAISFAFKDQHKNYLWKYECLVCGKKEIAQKQSVMRNALGCLACANKLKQKSNTRIRKTKISEESRPMAKELNRKFVMIHTANSHKKNGFAETFNQSCVEINAYTQIVDESAILSAASQYLYGTEQIPKRVRPPETTMNLKAACVVLGWYGIRVLEIMN